MPFEALPLSKSHPDARLNAWGAHGEDDERGFLNRQTNAIVAAAAASEIRSGSRVTLDAPMDLQGEQPSFRRKAFEKEMWLKSPKTAFDDIWHFNTQSSTQWDGLRHYGYQKAARFYNGISAQDILGESEKGRSNPHVLGIQNMTQRGVVGRGILVDFARWRATGPGKDMAKDYTALDSCPISLGWIQAVLDWQGTEVKFGDILIIRSGFMERYRSLTTAELDQLTSQRVPPLGGVEQSEEMLRWIWDHFSAVAADHPTFERWPTPHEWSMHEVLLAGWGCPLGEWFDLEELSVQCEREARWSFFFVSNPVNVPGGVASPPCSLAIF